LKVEVWRGLKERSQTALARKNFPPAEPHSPAAFAIKAQDDDALKRKL